LTRLPGAAIPPAMQRIAIVGCSGGGKSTLARALGERLGLTAVHLDTLFWKPGWVESAPAPFRAAVDQAASGERWVMDGNFTGASPLRFARADTIVCLDQPRLVCLWRALWRAVSAFGRVRADLAPGCPEPRIDLAFYRYIWTWERVTRPKVERAIAAHGAGARLIRLRGDREIAAFADDPDHFRPAGATNRR
jgi:adenylate kinase family enzyme